jgi:hypothetical protein
MKSVLDFVKRSVLGQASTDADEVMEESTGVKLLDLHDLLLERVMQFLPVQDLSAFRRTCSAAKQVSHDAKQDLLM